MTSKERHGPAPFLQGCDHPRLDRRGRGLCVTHLGGYPPLRPYTDKLLGALDNANAWTEGALTASFMSAGIPPDASQQAAWWLTNIVI